MARNQNSVRLTRPVGSKEPYQFRPIRLEVLKEVGIGWHAPGDHFASAIGRWVPAGELYDNRKRS